MRRGARLIDDCERRFLAVLSEADAEQLKNALHDVIATDQWRAGPQPAGGDHRRPGDQ
jgi:hypothetical protein